MGARARLTALLAAGALAGCRGGERAGAVAVPSWSRDLPGDTAVVLWSTEGQGPPQALESVVRWLMTTARMRRIEAGPVVALAPEKGQATGWKSLAESPDFAEAFGKVAAEQGGLFVSGLWIEPWVAGLAERLPPMVKKRVPGLLRVSSLRYAWLGYEGKGNCTEAKGAIELTGPTSGLLGFLGSSQPRMGLAADRRRRLELQVAVDGPAVRRTLSALLEGDDSAASALVRNLPTTIVEPLLSAIPRHDVSVLVEMDELQDAIACIPGIDVPAVARVLTLLGPPRGKEWELPQGFVARVSHEPSQLFVRGPGAPEGSGLALRTEAGASPRSFSATLHSQDGSPPRYLVIDKRIGQATLPVELRF